MPQTTTPYDLDRWLAIWVLTAIMVAAALFRLPSLGIQSLWSDEAATMAQVSGTLTNVLLLTSQDNYPPLYNLLAWASVQLFGDSEWALRLPAALLGLATIPLTYFVGQRVGGRAVGLLAALLLALSGFHIWYSQEARMYTLLAFGATAHGLAMLRFMHRADWINAGLLVGSGLVLLYSHPYGALTIAPLAAVGGLHLLARRELRPLLGLVASEAAVAFAFLPWAIVLLSRAEHIDNSGFWIDPPTLEHVYRHLRNLTSGLLVLAPLSLILILFRRRLRPMKDAVNLWLVVAWAVVPAVLGIIASLVFEPVFISRYVIGSLPAMLVLASVALVAPARNLVGLTVALLLGLVLGFVSRDDGPSLRSDMRSMGSHIQAQIQPGDCLVLNRPYHRRLVQYYVQSPIDCVLSGDFEDTALAAPPSARIFLVAMSPHARLRAANAAPFQASRETLTSFHTGNYELFIFAPLGPR